MSEPPSAQSVPASPLAEIQFVQTMTFPVEVLLPLRLIIFNRNARRALITGQETQLPRPLAEWLAKESPLRGKLEIVATLKEGSDVNGT